MSGAEISGFTGDHVYLDTNIFIYFAEGHERHREVLTELFSMIDDRALHAHTSELTLAEVLVRRVREERADIAALYEQLISSRPSLQLWPITRAILRQSAALRARTGNRLPDAIHVATAEAAEVDFVLTADAGLRLPESVRLVLLDDLKV